MLRIFLLSQNRILIWFRFLDRMEFTLKSGFDYNFNFNFDCNRNFINRFSLKDFTLIFFENWNFPEIFIKLYWIMQLLTARWKDVCLTCNWKSRTISALFISWWIFVALLCNYLFHLFFWFRLGVLYDEKNLDKYELKTTMALCTLQYYCIKRCNSPLSKLRDFFSVFSNVLHKFY